MTLPNTKTINPFQGIINFHRFLVSQLFYPILLSSLLAGVLFSLRAFQSQSFLYQNLIWNLFLAWLPYIFSLLAALLDNLFKRHWWLLIAPGLLWIIFFPNAPYLVTDFLHLRDYPRVPIWYDIGMLATFAWTGCFLAIASLRTMQTLVQKYMGWFLGWIFTGIALSLGGLGIFLGRISRWNSWDLLLQPKSIIYEVTFSILDPFNNLQFFGFTTLYTAFLLVCYLTFISVRQIRR
jgi:uncharacterized membrane protein